MQVAKEHRGICSSNLGYKMEFRSQRNAKKTAEERKEILRANYYWKGKCRSQRVRFPSDAK